MAAGVGKTYRMLQEGQAEREAGRDVVIGYLEPHKRQDTIEQAAGAGGRAPATGRLPRHGARGDGPPGVARPRPELALIDELAHTNAPGVEHEKRYEDIADVLAAGIDVFSTVNVQHLESLNDQVAELTGVRVRETVPDSVLGTADEVVLIDLTPEALIARLRAGKVYPDQNIDAGAEQLLPDREPAGAARGRAAPGGRGGRVEAARDRARTGVRRRARRSESRPTCPKAVGERILALIRPQPSSQRLVRRAWRSAQRLGADARPALGEAAGQRIGGQGEAARGAAPPRLGAGRRASDRGERRPRRRRPRRSASRRGTTYIFIGESRPRRGLARLREPLPQRLMRKTPPGVDVRIVADRRERAEADQGEEAG